MSKHHKMSYHEAMTSSACKDEYRMVKGMGFPVPRDKKYAKAIIYGRDDYPEGVVWSWRGGNLRGDIALRLCISPHVLVGLERGGALV